jgi:hypothetical protein
MKAMAVMPPKPNRIETRGYDKLDIRFDAFISIAATLIWLA